ncbi:hypothetical protein M405DRAFT_832024 [Rhizopogon salebrosus TDB-379]|nr:hypothetical protein M405DRAFT_832024 [Rhizopogon salebrosus TDB-379]
MPVRGTRCYSQLQSAAAASTRQISPSFPSETSMHATDVRYPYFIRRNSRGSLPVYTDIRNGGTRYLVSIRNVHGQINSLANELQQSLFKHGSPEANRLKVQVTAQRHVILSGGRWKNDVINWLMSKGF